MLDAYTHQPRLEPPTVVTRFELPPYGQLASEIARDRWLVERTDRLARPEGLRISDIEDPEYEYPIIMCRPTLTDGIFALRTQYARAVVLVNYASGTTPHWLAPVIARLTANGVPVFLVADCPADDAGITKIAYVACLPAIDAGATIIEKVNSHDASLVKEAAKDWSEQLQGQALADYIGRMFAYQENEARPVPEMDTPEAIERYRVEVVLPTLIRLGIDRSRAEEISEKWKTVPMHEYCDLINAASNLPNSSDEN